MSGENSNVKRRRSSGLEDEEETEVQKDKKKRIEPIETQLAQSIQVEWRNTGSKRSRSKSNDADDRNVRARMSVDLSCTNPEPSSFLMGVVNSELENISQMIAAPSSPLANLSPSSSSSPSPQSSPDYYDRIVMRGHEILEGLRQDPDLMKHF